MHLLDPGTWMGASAVASRAMRVVDLAIVAAFVLYAITNGLRRRRKASRGLDEYFLAGRSLPGWKAGLSMAATQFAADTPLLVTGLVATAGVFALWRLWIYAFAFLLLGFLLGPSWRRAGVITDAELTELRYGGPAAASLRTIKAVYFGIVFNCTVLAWVLLAAARIAEPFLLWHDWLPGGFHAPVVALVEYVGVPLTANLEAPDAWVRSADNLISIVAILVFTTAYSTTGGLRSVVDTDVGQMVLMLAGTFAFAWVAVDAAGGLAVLPSRLAEAPDPLLDPQALLAFDPTWAKDASTGALLVIGVQWLAQLNADGTGYLAQRTMACRSDRDAQIAGVVFAVTQVLLRSLLWLPLAVALVVLYPADPTLGAAAQTAAREATYVQGIVDLLPTGVRGLLLTAMLAALASTVDTHLNWGSSYVTRDLYERFFCQHVLRRAPSDRGSVWVARATNVVLLVVALGVMTQLGSIADAWTTSLLLGAGLGVVLLLRWCWWRVSAWAELTAIGASFVAAVVAWRFVVAGDGVVDVFGWPVRSGSPATSAEAWRLLLVASVGTLAAVAVSWLGPRERMEVLRRFYERASPPGFWGPVARACAADPSRDRRRLGRGLTAVGLGGIAIFCLLTGVGSLLLGSPAPMGGPPRPLWIGSLLVTGVALAPIAWRLASRLPVVPSGDGTRP